MCYRKKLDSLNTLIKIAMQVNNKLTKLGKEICNHKILK